MGKEFGFKIGGMDADEKSFYNAIAYWNNSDKEYRLIVTDSMLAGNDIQTFLKALYIQYKGGDIEQKDFFYYVELKNRPFLTKESAKRIFDLTPHKGYTIASHQLLTKNLDH